MPFDEDMKSFCRCPLSGQVMTDPYLLNQTGVSYQKDAIASHIATHGTDPATGAPLRVMGITRNATFQRFVLSNLHLLGGAADADQ